MEHIKIEDVVTSYNGKSGCMCGCLGKYSTKNEEGRQTHNNNSGWESIGADGIKPRAISIAVGKINKAIDEYGYMTPEERDLVAGLRYFDVNENYASVDFGGRNTAVYFKPYYKGE